MSIKQPVTQVRLTNIAVVRLKQGGIRYEVACYKNKIIDYRTGKETDINEVLQTVQVFSNVSKGILANTRDIKQSFSDVVPVVNDGMVCKYILDHGVIQVSEKERQIEYENKYREIAVLISSITINSDTQRPFSVSMIESSMKQIHCNISINKNTKSQSLQIMKQLKSVLSTLQRAQMRLRIILPIAVGKSIKSKLHQLFVLCENETFEYEYDSTVIIDPGQFRSIEELVAKEGKGRGRIDILDHKILNDEIAGDDIDELTQIQSNNTTNKKSNDKDYDTPLYMPTLAPVINDDEIPGKRNKKGKNKLPQQSNNNDTRQSTNDVTDSMSTMTIDKPTKTHVSRKQLKKLAKKQEAMKSLSDSNGDSDSGSDSTSHTDIKQHNKTNNQPIQKQQSFNNEESSDSSVDEPSEVIGKQNRKNKDRNLNHERQKARLRKASQHTDDND